MHCIARRIRSHTHIELNWNSQWTARVQITTNARQRTPYAWLAESSYNNNNNARTNRKYYVLYVKREWIHSFIRTRRDHNIFGSVGSHFWNIHENVVPNDARTRFGDRIGVWNAFLNNKSGRRTRIRSHQAKIYLEENDSFALSSLYDIPLRNQDQIC